MIEQYNLSTIESSVFNYLASVTSKDKKYCYASNSSICDLLKLNDRTLYRALSSLEDMKLITRETRSNGHYGKERKIYVNTDNMYL